MAAEQAEQVDDEEDSSYTPSLLAGLPNPLNMPKISKGADGGFFTKVQQPEPDAKHPKQLQMKMNALNDKMKPVPTDEQKKQFQMAHKQRMERSSARMFM